MRRALAFVSLAFLAGCGGSSNPGGPGPVPSPTPTPPLADRSVIVLGHRNNRFTVTSRTMIRRLEQVCGDAHVEFVFAEQAGLGATLTQAETYLLAANGDILQRQVRPADDRIEAQGTAEFQTNRTQCGIVGRDYPFSFHSIWTWQDDNGNQIVITGDIGLIEQ